MLGRIEVVETLMQDQERFDQMCINCQDVNSEEVRSNRRLAYVPSVAALPSPNLSYHSL